MTLIKAIQEFDALRRNEVAIEQKIKWISELDEKISADYLEVRGYEPFSGYGGRCSLEIELKAPAEYGEIYTLYLNMKLDYMNGEITRFNNSAVLFNRLYKEMGDAINRKTKVKANIKIKAGDLYV